MSKIKFKLFDKFFSQKNRLSDKEGYQKSTNNNTYFSNVVPPINKNKENIHNSDFNENDYNEKKYDGKNIQVTSSYIIPLQEKKTVPINENFTKEKDMYYDQPQTFNTMEIVSYKNSFKIPKPISREIKSEKLKQLILLFIGVMTLIIASTFIGLYFGMINIKIIPHPVITIPLAIIALTIILINIIEFVTLRREVDLYIERTLKGSLLPPNFIIRNYRKIHANLIIINWISISSYIVLGIIIGIMFLISGQKLTFIIQKWTVNVPDIIKDAITLTIILGVILFIHMINIVIFKFRKRNIISYYGYEIINPQELNQYKKKINRICMIITIGFTALIFFAIVIPIFVLKRRKKK
ncbi:MSC_0882 family membrane protein [Spiroplasma endosymbiont of Nomada rufipes]|uniref:MSC_0882 family membrane protein n=1 Tax=Spiroplasma endosymbiont of Nomada rufipes TaxID=3077933 RepID=UPI00376F0EF0